MRRKKAPDGRGLQNLFMEIFMSLSIVFQNHSVRNVFENEKFWFCAKDVCKVLEIRNSRDAIRDLDETQKGVVSTDTPGGKQQLVFVDEDGLFGLIFKSRKPEAKAFQAYVRELVKSHYNGQLLTLEQHNAALEAHNAKLAQAVVQQHETIQIIERMFDTSGCMEMKDAAKMLKEYFCDEGSTLVGRNKLFQFLRDMKVLMKNDTPYQKFAHHFVVNPTTKTVYLKNSSLVWMKNFVHDRIPKKASVLQIAHVRKGFIMNDPDEGAAAQ